MDVQTVKYSAPLNSKDHFKKRIDPFFIQKWFDLLVVPPFKIIVLSVPYPSNDEKDDDDGTDNPLAFAKLQRSKAKEGVHQI